MRERSRWIAMMIGCGVIGGFAGDIARSFADNTPATSNLLNQGVVLPYDGYLMLDSSPVNKPDQEVRFSLYESVSGGTAQWVENQTVNVVNGKFSVALGSNANNKVSSSPANATFSDVMLDAQKLYIGIEVKNDQGQFIELSGRQEIQPAPYAAWSARSADFKAEGDLTVEGVTRPQNGIVMRNDTSISGLDQLIGHNDLRLSGSSTNTTDLLITSSGDVLMRGGLDVNGSTSLDGVQVDGSSTFNGSVTASGFADFNDAVSSRGHLYVESTDLYLGTNNSAGRGNGGRALVQNFSDSLYVNYAGDFTGGTVINSNTTVTGNLSVQGDLQAWPAGSYCILRSGPTCPSGFSGGEVYFDTEDDSPNNARSGSTGAASVGNNISLYFCCK